MTIIQLHDRFSVIVDKEGSPDLIDKEFTDLINIGQLAIVKDIVEGELKNKKEEEMPPHAFENVSHLSERIAPLISSITTLSTDTDGRIQYSAINGLLSTSFYHIANIARLEAGTFHFCRFVRHNDRYKHELNAFKKPTVTNPIVMKFANFLQILPNTASVSVNMVTIRFPKDVNFDEVTPANNIDPELPDNTMLEVLFRGLQLAGISIREPQLYQTTTVEEGKTA